MKKIIFISLLIILSLISCEKDTPVNGNNNHEIDLSPGLNDLEIEFDNLTREFYVITPDDFSPDSSYPVVFFFHGLGGNKEFGRSVLSELMLSETFIGVSPQGYLNSWNAGSGGVPSTADDVGFTMEILRLLDEAITINLDYIYSMGYSNGGGFSYNLAINSDSFAAVVSMSASFYEGRTIPSNVKNISVMQIHGDSDQVVPYNGGQSISLPIVFESAMHTVTLWSSHDGLSQTPTIEYPENNLIKYSFTGQNNPYEVILYCLNETSHNISTHPFYSSGRVYTEIWDFFIRNHK